MTVGVGGSTAEKELAAMTSMRGDVPPIGVEERRGDLAQQPPPKAKLTIQGVVDGRGARVAAVVLIDQS